MDLHYCRGIYHTYSHLGFVIIDFLVAKDNFFSNVLSFVKAMQHPLGFYKYVVEPKRFLIYPNRDISFVLNNYGHEKYPYNSLDQNNSMHSVYKILSSGYCFLF
jgi:hypothetical protein